MSLIDDMYAGRALPASTCPHKVGQIHNELVRRLERELNKSHVWLAACTVAVQAGHWRGDRLLKRRLKLLDMINTCRLFLDTDVLKPETGWARKGLVYGYGAHNQWRRETGHSAEATFALSEFVLTALKINNGIVFAAPGLKEELNEFGEIMFKRMQEGMLKEAEAYEEEE